MIGQSIGNYRVIDKLSEGGMGVVFRAEHALIGKAAAIKVLLPELSQRREIVERFFNEAKATSAIRHPGIVEIFDFGYDATGQAYIVMEFLAGETLGARLKAHGRLPAAMAVMIMRGIASAVGAAHAKGIVHRDLKPDNVFLVPDPDMPSGERPKVLDFGIAKLADGSGAMSRTRTGAMMGTPTYMAPEQCRGAGSVDLRADIYAVGCILFELVVGMPPFVAEGFGEIITAHMITPPPSPRQFDPSISLELEAIIMCCLAKHPDQRFPTMEALIAALDSTGMGRRSEQMAWAAPTAMLSTGGAPPSYHSAPGIGSAPGLAHVPAMRTFPTNTPVPSSAPTTLGGAAAEARQPTMPPPSAGKGKLMAIGAVMLAAAVGVGFAVSQRGGDKGSDSTQAAGEKTPPESDPPVSTKDKDKPVEPKEVVTPPIDPVTAPDNVSIALELTPADAQVLLDGVAVTTNPIILPRSDKTYAVEIRAPGHLPETSELKADVNSRIKLALAKETKVAKDDKGGGSKPKDPKKPKKPKDKPGSGGSSGPIEDDI